MAKRTREANSPWNRRQFLKFVGSGTLVAWAAPWSSGCTTAKLVPPTASSTRLMGIQPSAADELVLHKGLVSRVLLREGDTINSKGDVFGSCSDYLALTNFDQAQTDVMLWVNHEYFDPLMVSGRGRDSAPTKDQMKKEMRMVGGSLVRLQREPNSSEWRVVKNSPYNRRLDAHSKIPIIAPRPIAGKKVAIGTMANCAGGFTPWKTVLTCEENFQDYWGAIEKDAAGNEKKIGTYPGIGWNDLEPRPSEHYGWVVEVDPFTGKSKKLTSLGRMAHECATVTLAKDQRAVVYMGDDKADEHIYKFISEKPGTLEKGELFVADTVQGKWLSLDLKKQASLQGKFKDQTDVHIQARYAAKILGATPQDRPEDVEIQPNTGHVFVTLTNNKDKKNFFGSILKIEEAQNDPLSMEFKASTFIAGGENAGFACPDNLVFDRRGNLWMTSDISGSSMHKEPYAKFKNNGLFFIPMYGPQAGTPIQVGSAPRDAELTGPTFSDDGRTLFLSVQHPGEESVSSDQYTSHWPDGGNSKPLSSVVTITGPLLDQYSSVV